MNKDVKYKQVDSKIVLCGAERAGKTALLQLLTKPKARIEIDKYAPTIGVEFQSITLANHGHPHRLQIWDTAGQERFRSLIPAYLSAAKIICLVWDPLMPKWFEELTYFFEMVRGRTATTPIIFVQTKSDIPVDKAVLQAQYDQIKGLVDGPFELAVTSAKTMEGIDDLRAKLHHKAYAEHVVNDPTLERGFQSGGNSTAPKSKSKGSCWCCFLPSSRKAPTELSHLNDAPSHDFSN